MKKYIICTIFFCFLGLLAFSQEKQHIAALGQDNPNASYRLYPTTNMWTFLKLNTEDGRIWQVQYSMVDENRFETYLNAFPLATGSDKKPGRFTLYPTQNMWTFILLDTIKGSTWQVQWSLDADKRGILPISN